MSDTIRKATEGPATEGRKLISQTDTLLRVVGDKNGVRIEEYDARGVLQTFDFSPEQAHAFSFDMTQAASAASNKAGKALYGPASANRESAARVELLATEATTDTSDRECGFPGCVDDEHLCSGTHTLHAGCHPHVQPKATEATTNTNDDLCICRDGSVREDIECSVHPLAWSKPKPKPVATATMYKEPDDAIIPVANAVAPWRCYVCGVLVLDHERHEHTAKEWRNVER